MVPKKGVPSAVVWTVRRLCLDCVVGLEESSTGGILRPRKFCHLWSGSIPNPGIFFTDSTLLTFAPLWRFELFECFLTVSLSLCVKTMDRTWDTLETLLASRRRTIVDMLTTSGVDSGRRDVIDQNGSATDVYKLLSDLYMQTCSVKVSFASS